MLYAEAPILLVVDDESDGHESFQGDQTSHSASKGSQFIRFGVIACVLLSGVALVSWASAPHGRAKLLKGTSDRSMFLQASDAKALVSKNAQQEDEDAWRDEWHRVLDCSASCKDRFDGDSEKHAACYRDECRKIEKVAKAESVMLPAVPAADASKLDIAPNAKTQFLRGTDHSGLLRTSAEKAAAKAHAQEEEEDLEDEWHKVLDCSASCLHRFDGDAPKHAACYRAECKTLERAAKAETISRPGDVVSSTLDTPPKEVKY